MKNNHGFLTTTQFFIILLINIIALALWVYHFMNIKTITEVKHEVQTNTVYKDRTVEKCSESQMYQDEMNAASNLCATSNNNGVSSFSIDATGKPVVKCKS